MGGRSSAATAGIIIIVLFVILGYNNFDLGILTGQTATVTGTIYNIKPNPTRGGYLQIADYAFKIDGQDYFGSKRIGRKDGYQILGNSVKVEYAINRPEKNKARGFSEKLNIDAPEEYLLYQYIGRL